MEGLKAFKPDGAFYLYVSCEGLINKKYGTNKIINDFDFANFLLNEANVAIVPGQAFGKSPFLGRHMQRLLNELEIACDRIKKSLNFCHKMESFNSWSWRNWEFFRLIFLKVDLI